MGTSSFLLLLLLSGTGLTSLQHKTSDYDHIESSTNDDLTTVNARDISESTVAFNDDNFDLTVVSNGDNLESNTILDQDYTRIALNTESNADFFESSTSDSDLASQVTDAKEDYQSSTSTKDYDDHESTTATLEDFVLQDDLPFEPENEIIENNLDDSDSSVYMDQGFIEYSGSDANENLINGDNDAFDADDSLDFSGSGDQYLNDEPSPENTNDLIDSPLDTHNNEYVETMDVVNENSGSDNRTNFDIDKESVLDAEIDAKIDEYINDADTHSNQVVEVLDDVADLLGEEDTDLTESMTEFELSENFRDDKEEENAEQIMENELSRARIGEYIISRPLTSTSRSTTATSTSTTLKADMYSSTSMFSSSSESSALSSSSTSSMRSSLESSSASSTTAESSPTVSPSIEDEQIPVPERLVDNRTVQIDDITEMVKDLTEAFQADLPDIGENVANSLANTDASKINHVDIGSMYEELGVLEDQCDCICDSRYRYQVDTADDATTLVDGAAGGDVEGLQIILKEEQRICTDEELSECCTILDFQPLDVEQRIRFPDEDGVGVAEDVLVDSQGIPRVCQQFIQNEQHRCESSTVGPAPTCPQLEELLMSESHATVVQESISSQLMTAMLGPHGSWHLTLNLSYPATISLKPSARSDLPLLGRLNGAPSTLEFDILSRLEATRLQELQLHLSPGEWSFLIQNGESYAQEVLLTVGLKPTEHPVQIYSDGCKNIFGQQICANDADCGHGYRSDGGCRCSAGWMGPSCSTRLEACGEEMCSGFGHCVWGVDILGYKRLRCECWDGHTGDNCEKLNCANCTQGICTDEGTCKCFEGWKGENCTEAVISTELICPLDIQPVSVGCDPGCGEHGECGEGICVCAEGWGGESCTEKLCDPRCSLHGVCEGGECICTEGWGGTHCTLDHCPNACSGHGRCTNLVQGWMCRCEVGWFGTDCSVPRELNCADGQDDDGDGLVDCKDPECCYSESCARSQFCSTVPDPLSRLVETEEMHEFSSFFEINKFLIAEGSVQRYAKEKEFDPSRVSLVSGRVLTGRGEGLVGVRVSVSGARGQGFTLTRHDGWFHLLVNGGGLLTLRFGKSPFSPLKKNVYVAWNQYHVMEDVMLYKNSVLMDNPDGFCEDHVTSLLKPSVQVTPLQNKQGSLVEEFPLEGTTISLVYSSHRTRGYHSVLTINMVDNQLPSSLITVHTRITIAGRVFTSVHEADRNLTEEFLWDRKDVFGRKVYGKSEAEIWIGYQYKMCAQIIWRVHRAEIHGYTPPAWQFDGWSFNLLHRFNPKDGILYKGDGSTIDLQEKENLVVHMNENFTRTLIGPQAVAVDSTGNLYVGDTTHIRRIDKLGVSTELLKINSSTASNGYYMSLDPTETNLYVSDPINYRIIRVNTSPGRSTSLTDNFQVVLGGTGRCLVNDENNCGDGLEKRFTKLIHPKGLGFTRNGDLVFVDGTSVRRLRPDGRVDTVAGSVKRPSEWKPEICGREKRTLDANLKWPTSLSVNLVDDTVGIVDDGAVLVINLREKRITEVFSSTCTGDLVELEPRTLSYTSTGDMIVSDDKNRIYKVSPDLKINEVAGSLTYCKRQENGCLISDFNNIVTTGSKARFSSISDTAVGPDGTLYVADRGSHRVSSVLRYRPTLNEEEKYEILSPDSQEVHVFDEGGRHLHTNGLLAPVTGIDILSADPTIILSITDRNGNKLRIDQMDDRLVNLVMYNREPYRLRINKNRNLEQIIAPNKLIHAFTYVDSTGLVQRIFTGGKFGSVFEYSAAGHVTRSQAPVMPVSVDSDNKEDVFTVVTREQENQLIRALYGTEYLVNRMPGSAEVRLENSTVHRVGWNYFEHTITSRSSFGSNVDGIGKRFVHDGREVFTSELHPRSMIQSIYTGATLRIKVEHYYEPRGTVYNLVNHWIEQKYNRQGNPEVWEWSGRRELIQYDDNGRIISVSNCRERTASFQYLYNDSMYPSHVGEYRLQHDNMGGLQSITTPAGEHFSFQVQATLGNYVLYLKVPWQSLSIKFELDYNGRVTKMINQHQIQRNRMTKDTVTVDAGTDILSETVTKQNQILQTVQDLTNNRELRVIINFNIDKVNVRHQQVFPQARNISEYSCTKTEADEVWRLECQGTLVNSEIHLTQEFSRVDQRELSLNMFEVQASVYNVVYTNTDKQIQIKVVYNIYKEEERFELTVRKKPVYTRAQEYDCTGRLVRISEKFTEAAITEFNYTEHGRIHHVSSRGVRWRYDYDEAGNFVNVDYGLGNTTFIYEHGERVIRGGYNQVEYSDSGNLIGRGGYTFQYNQLNQLTSLSYKDQYRKQLVYDSRGRIVQIIDEVTSDTVHLMYMDSRHPWQITHVLYEKSRLVQRLTYSRDGNLISLESGGRFFIVLTKIDGTPTHLLDQTGEVVREMYYSPFGTKIEDTNEDLPLLIGFKGGVSLDEARITVIKGRPYDNILGSWMVPVYTDLINLPTKPTQVHLYRFNNNDPINNIQEKYYDSLNAWLEYFNFNLDILRSPLIDPERYRTLQPDHVTLPRFLQVGKPPSSTAVHLLDPAVQRTFALQEDKRRPLYGNFFHVKIPLLGPNILISRRNKTLITRIMEGSTTVEKLMAQVLNRSIIMEDYGNPQDFYFLQNQVDTEKISKLKEYLQLRENLIPPYGREFCIQGAGSHSICVLDGIESVDYDFSAPEDDI